MRTLFAILLWVGGAMAAAAQPAPTQPGRNDDMRPLYATPVDVTEGKRLAQTTCAPCHGADGVAARQGVPHLAGQRAGYLYRELRAYVSGARGNEDMNRTVKFLSIDALIDVAAYYASLDPALPASGEAAIDPDPLQAGKAAAAGCAGCHGETGISKTPGTPSLVGLEPKYLVTAVQAYLSGQRGNDIMKAMGAAVPASGLGDVALYFALQKAARAETPAKGDVAAGQALAPVCAGCHGAQGVSGNPTTPSLAGQDAQYLAAALHAYKDGSRTDATMKGLAAGLDDMAITNLAAFYAGLQPQAPDVRKPLSTAQWVERCDRCHGVNGNSTDPRIPALAAQREEYLQSVLGAYRTGARRSPEMAAMSDVLSENAVRSLAAYYAHQKARAVVYVPIPPR
jgi:cytochrome c553